MLLLHPCLIILSEVLVQQALFEMNETLESAVASERISNLIAQTEKVTVPL
jgi:hypothetical protein